MRIPFLAAAKWLAVSLLVFVMTSSSHAQLLRHRRCYPRPSEPSVTVTDDAEETEDAAPVAPDVELGPLDTSLDVAATPLSFAPGMIGDSGMTGGFVPGTSTSVYLPPAAQATSLGGGARIFKFAENDSPLLTDRVFFVFNQYASAMTAANGQGADLQAYTLGVEKVFCNGLYSAELRVPFTSGFDSYQMTGAANRGGEFGNVSFALKRLIAETDDCVLTAGLGFAVPTAGDATLFDGGAEILTIHNEAFHLSPFIGLLRTPTDRLFWMAYAQLDFDTNGNSYRSPAAGTSGRLQDPNLLFLDASVGYWICRNESARYFTGIAPMVELHYTTTVSDADITADAGGPSLRFDVLNITGAIHVQICEMSNVRISAVAPLNRDQSDRFFDSEIAVHFNRYY